MNYLEKILRSILVFLFRIQLKGLENYQQDCPKLLITANHQSFLDALLLALFLPKNVAFAINTEIFNLWWIKPFRKARKLIPIEPSQPLSTRRLIKLVNAGVHLVVFPEGRITSSGAMMKAYSGTGMIVMRTSCKVLPVGIEGAHLSYFSRTSGKYPQQAFPKISLSFGKIYSPELTESSANMKIQRQRITDKIVETIKQELFSLGNQSTHLLEKLIESAKLHGMNKTIFEDSTGQSLSYRLLLQKILILSRLLSPQVSSSKTLGILLPTSIGGVVSIFASMLLEKLVVLLNFSAGTKNCISAVKTSELKTIITSRNFVEKAKLENLCEELSTHLSIIYLEDLRAELDWQKKLLGLACLIAPFRVFRHSMMQQKLPQGDDPACILFTSGSEGSPKGVVLSHNNFLKNVLQIHLSIDVTPKDRMLSALPIFHAFGLTAGCFLPLFSGTYAFLYPSPLHYRIIPEVIYDKQLTIMFGADTFLSQYAKSAHAYDMHSLRYVAAGAEKLQDSTYEMWFDKFGIRIFQGYGVTESSPGVSVNTPIDNKRGSVGKLFVGLRAKLLPVEGIENAGELHLAGPNIMLGYMRESNPGQIEKIPTTDGIAWYNTGDIARIDADGFLFIEGRLKRFAKIAGEMVSLGAVEEELQKLYPQARHAVIAIKHQKKGEQLVLVSNTKILLKELKTAWESAGLSPLWLPRKIQQVAEMPVLSTGKLDFASLQRLVENQ